MKRNLGMTGLLRIIIASAIALSAGCMSQASSPKADFISAQNALELIRSGSVATASIDHSGIIALSTIDGRRFWAKEPRGYPLSKALRSAPNASEISVWIE